MKYAVLITILAFATSSCASQKIVPDNCPYYDIAKSGISHKYPWFIPPGGDLKLARKGSVVEAYYPLPHVMPGGSAYAEVNISDCTLSKVYITQ